MRKIIGVTALPLTWLLLFVVFMLAAMLNNAVLSYPTGVPYDPTYHGYHRSVIPGMAVLLACALWLGWQRRAAG
jgi:hypothetical protein